MVVGLHVAVSGTSESCCVLFSFRCAFGFYAICTLWLFGGGGYWGVCEVERKGDEGNGLESRITSHPGH